MPAEGVKTAGVGIVQGAGVDTPPRVAYAIGKRVGGAVERNRLRRRLRPIVSDLAAAGSLAFGDYLIGARAEACSLSSADLRSAASAVLGDVQRRATGAR